MIQFSNQEISNERLVLKSKTELFYLGHHLTLRNCTLVVEVPAKALVIARAHLIDCLIEVKGLLKNFRWTHAHLRGCRFKGCFAGNDFGSWYDTPEEGSIEGCDFTEAQLTSTRFLGCDMSTMRLPSWPCFTVFDPPHRWRDWRALPWPGDIGPVVIEGFSEYPPNTAAVVYSATELAKKSHTTPEAIRAVLEKADGVTY